MTTNDCGRLIDAQENMLDDNCTLSDAIDWLKAFGGRGWRGGDTTWLAHESDRVAVIGDADEEFAVRENPNL